MTNIETYLMQFPAHVRDILTSIRKMIRLLAPESEELISYGMPTYKLNKKPLVYFGAFKNHIGFYALPSGHEAFQQELSSYKQGKGSVQFPLDQPMPYDLIKRMVQFRVNENKSKEGKLKEVK